MEPFKATKLWNKIIQDFRSLMPLKRHRWRMRPYDNCFTTTEAVDWLHEYLQGSSDFGPWVTRNQAVSLLEKFVQSKVIQQVKVGKTSKTRLSADGFEDNGQLYRFVPVSPIKKLRSAFSSRSNLRTSPKGASPDLPQKPLPRMQPLDEATTTTATQTMTPQTLRTTRSEVTPVVALQTKPVGALHPRPLRVRNEVVGATQGDFSSAKKVPQCALVAKNLTRKEIEGVWKSATLMRLQRLLWLSSLEGLLNADVVNPKHLIHNCTHLSRGGVVLVSNKDQDLPHWVLSAMKCLARWPNQTDSSLPAYPGFERDVFRTVFNYFDTLPEPLLTNNLYPLVTEAFITAEHRDRGIAPPGYEEEVLPPCTSTNSGMATFESVENLMLNMTMGGYNDSMPTPGGYVNPPVATPHGLLDGPITRDQHNPYFEAHEGVKERDRPVYRRSVSMRIQSTPQIPHGNGTGDSHNRDMRSGFQRYGACQHWQRENESNWAKTRGPALSTTSVNEYQSRSYEEAEHRNINRIGDISEYYRYGGRPNKRHRPNSAHSTLLSAPKFSSESNIHQAGYSVEQQHVGYQPRHFGSMTDIGNSDEPIPYMDAPCPRVIGRSPQSAWQPSPVVDSNQNSTNTSPTTDGSYHTAFGSIPSTGNPSPNMGGPSPTESNTSKGSAFGKLFRSSKKFGSASDLFQKILRKKSDSSLNRYHCSNPSRDSSTNHTPPVTFQPTAHRSTTNSAASSKNNTPAESEKISPSYPPPMRATLSMSQIISSTENSTNTTPETQTASVGSRSTTSLSVHHAWPTSRTLDPFQQGLSQSSRNLRSSQPGLSRLSRNLRSSQQGLSESSRAVSAYSLNRSGMSEFGLTGSRLKRSDSASSLYLNEDQSYMQESLKLCCLLLPPSNRRKLHLLLKLMSKIEQNEELQLSRTRSPRNLVLHTFTRCILRCREEIDLNERLAFRIVEYLMDNHATIFAVPQDLQADVNERLVYLRRGQIKYTPDEMMNDPPSFCRQVSVAQYEQQKVMTSQKAMEDLLESIIKDNRMTAKEKRKKLKQFQKAYPDIYAKRMQPSVRDAENVRPSHCQKVSTTEYKTQAMSASQRALEDLLENIITNDSMGAKDKKKRLKRFQKEYPDIYRKRLPTSESEAQLFPAASKPKIKQPMVNMRRSLHRWKSIR